jgi:hypothetical protein
MMFSREKMIEITGEVDFADRLEKIAFNPLPTQTTDDHHCRQYFQQANQVQATARPNAPPRGGRVEIVSRPWRDGDRLELQPPMTIRTSSWYENSVAIERGPLVYAMRLAEQWSEVQRPGPDSDDPTTPRGYREVRTPEPWNFALLQSVLNEPATGFEVVRTGATKANPWSLAGAPLELRTTGVRLAHWTLYHNSAGPVPLSPTPMPAGAAPAPIRLVPYGCTTLRIAAFPWIDNVKKSGRP